MIGLLRSQEPQKVGKRHILPGRAEFHWPGQKFLPREKISRCETNGRNSGTSKGLAVHGEMWGTVCLNTHPSMNKKLNHRSGWNRREFLKMGGLAAAAGSMGFPFPPATGLNLDKVPFGERPYQAPDVQVCNPFHRIPLSFIIDDSTCLVNMGHFCMPQFAQAFPERDDYRKPWREWPREIPDDFVREFADFCDSHGVKGKYSIVPYPACVGWLDRFLPGWSHGELKNSLKLVRERMCPSWDIHPEMISHTRVLDLKSGRPMEEISLHTMENSHPAMDVSSDYLAEYISRALQVLKNVDLPCEGFTTPGGFGNRVKSALSSAGAEAVRSVFGVDLPHYFKYLELDPEKSTQPRVEHASGLSGGDPSCMVNVIAGTGDWFGGWDGVSAGDIGESSNRFISADGTSGRMVEMIARNEPAIMLCHWPGIYCNGSREGFHIFVQTVRRLTEFHSGTTRWMKVSEIARYWAAKELTAIHWGGVGGNNVAQRDELICGAPYSTPGFTLRCALHPGREARVSGRAPLATVSSVSQLVSGSRWVDEKAGQEVLCFDLQKGDNRIVWK